VKVVSLRSFGTVRRAERQSEFLGHPRGLAVLFATEMWERFSYYGMRALLMLYMVKELLQPGHAERVLGYDAMRKLLQLVSGAVDVQPLASQIYGLYTGLVYLAPIFGGLLADRVLGRRRCVVLGAMLMALGHFMMAFAPLFLLALLTLILGSGAFKPNIVTQVGALYPPDDPRRDRAYSIFYVGINLGAFLAPLICGTVGEEAGFHYGFAIAGVGMLIALAIYLCVPAAASSQSRERRDTVAPRAKPAEEVDQRPLILFLALCLLLPLFWAVYEQQGNTMVLWADTFTDRRVNFVFWRGEIPVTWFQAANPLLIFALTPLIVRLWNRQAGRNSEPSSVAKMALGCFAGALAYAMMAAVAWRTGTDKASWLWLIAYFLLITTGELYLSPIGLSLVAKAAPAAMLSTLMGLWFTTNFFGNLLAGWLGGFWSTMARADFYLMLAFIAAIAGAAIAALGRLMPAPKE
jgi:proton-dependent oligopeptide transporter, POT family